MQYADIFIWNADSLPLEIQVFFRSHDVDMSNYKFDRKEANAR